MRFGLVGNGHWARVTHAAGLRAAGGPVELAGIWGRNVDRTTALAGELDVTGYADVDAMFAEVDAVAFSVPPSVQAELAPRAARQGCQLLLEKPIAVTADDARRLSDAVTDAGVASVVFFTGRFDPAQRSWIADTAGGDWDGAAGQWLGSAFEAGSPFDTPWRRQLGGLWDVGPHALAMSIGSLGPVTEIVARPGPRDLVQLLLGHAGGARTSYALSIDTPSVAAQNSLTVWGPAGRSTMPAGPADPAACLATAAGELVAAAGSGDAHPLDVRFGRTVVELLAAAQAQLCPALRRRRGSGAP